MFKTFIDKTFKDKDGKLAIASMPNFPIGAWAVCRVLTHFHLSSHIISALNFTGTAFLFVWAYLELTSGVNYFRRFLGLAVLAMFVIPKFL